jgi:hypothetical protein
MGDTCHIHRSGFVVDLDPVIANTNAPLVIAALQFLTARWARTNRQVLDPMHHSCN